MSACGGGPPGNGADLMAAVASSGTSSVAPGVNLPQTSAADERRLIAAAARGDTRAYGELLARHLPVAHRAAYLITGSAGEAEDAVQEASVKAWLALGRFRPGAPFRPWL